MESAFADWSFTKTLILERQKETVFKERFFRKSRKNNLLFKNVFAIGCMTILKTFTAIYKLMLSQKYFTNCQKTKNTQGKVLIILSFQECSVGGGGFIPPSHTSYG